MARYGIEIPDDVPMVTEERAHVAVLVHAITGLSQANTSRNRENNAKQTPATMKTGRSH